MDSLSKVFRSLRPSYAGFALLLSIEQYVHFQGVGQDSQQLLLFFGIQVLVLGACALLAHLGALKGAVTTVASGAASVGVALFLLHVAAEGEPGTPAIVLCGAAFALLYLPWFEAFERLDTREAFCCIFACQLLAGLIGAATAAIMPGVRAIVFAALTLASSFLGLDVRSNQPQANPPSVFYEEGVHREPVQYAIFLALFGLAAGCFNQGDASDIFLNPSWYFALWSLGSAILAFGCLWLVGRQHVEPTIDLVQRLFVVMILAYFLGAQAFPVSPLGQTIINCAISMGRTTVVNVFTLAMLDIARYARWCTPVVLCLGYALSILSFLVPEGAAIVAGAPLSSLPNFWIAAFAISSGSLLLVKERDFSSARVFADLCSPQHPISAHDAIEARCGEVAQKYGLSKREVDVLRYLSAGRTRAYIAESLFISESTVASHSKRIYQKLGVHSKRELMDLVDPLD